MKDVHIELASDISIFVGPNNSGKTSATQAIHTFARGAKDRFALYDFSSSCLKEFDKIGNQPEEPPFEGELPSISLDLWFEVAATDLLYVMPLLPSTAWSGTQVGIRIEFAARNPTELLQNFRKARKEAQLNAAALEKREGSKYVPWPTRTYPKTLD